MRSIATAGTRLGASRMLIHGGDVYTPDGVIRDGAVLVERSRIRAVGPYQAVKEVLPASDEIGSSLDARGGIIAPGFIDLQINGAGGKLLSEQPESESVQVMAGVLPRFGCTAFLPTIVTSSMERTIAALRAVEEARAAKQHGARVLGAHVEGPFINPERPGVHARELIRPPSVAELERFVREGSEHIVILTL